jgi:hypothetical protein
MIHNENAVCRQRLAEAEVRGDKKRKTIVCGRSRTTIEFATEVEGQILELHVRAINLLTNAGRGFAHAFNGQLRGERRISPV